MIAAAGDIDSFNPENAILVTWGCCIILMYFISAEYFSAARARHVSACTSTIALAATNTYVYVRRVLT